MAKPWKVPFIVIEALDAGGSQTQTDRLVRHLRREKYLPHAFHFPQEDRATGRLIYDKFLLHQNNQPFSRREQALLFLQDLYAKSEDFEQIRSRKKGRNIIVSDRFYTSTMAYQTIGLTGKARQQMLDWLTWLCNEGSPALLRPDLVIFLDTPVEVSLQRLAGKKTDFFETKQKLTAIRRSYLALAEEQKWVILDSVNDKGEAKTRPALHKEVWEYVVKS